MGLSGLFKVTFKLIWSQQDGNIDSNLGLLFSKVVPLNILWKILVLVTGFIFCRSFGCLLVPFGCLAALSLTEAVTSCCMVFHKQSVSHCLGKK